MSSNADYYGVKIGNIVEEDFEQYVAAVVASEIGNASLEACKAQAIASRTFAYRYILKDKVVSDGSSCQVYRAERYSNSYKMAIQATEATYGEILTYNGQPADTYFSHSNGGQTVSSKEKWGGDRSYLQSKPDPWTKASGKVKSGHGVGMSQVGAIYAASIGTGYKDILSFYYTGTKITKYVEKGVSSMISLEKFINGIKRNSARIKGYKQPYSGENGYSDCIGLIIGGLSLEGQKWGGIHGSNYAARKRSKNFHEISSVSDLKVGEVVYKAYAPGNAKYDLPSRYKSGGAYYNRDLNDYYHVGVVMSVNPLQINHCSGGGMHYDNKLGRWAYASECSLVDYGSSSTPSVTPVAPSITSNMIVDVPNDTSVNLRTKASVDANIITRIPEGTHVIVTSTSGSWSHVEYGYKKTGTGYVMSKFLVGNKVDVPDDTSVNVRSKPSASGNRITTIPEGTEVTIVSTTGSWSKVNYSFEQKGTGYVMSKYLKPVA